MILSRTESELQEVSTTFAVAQNSDSRRAIVAALIRSAKPVNKVQEAIKRRDVSLFAARSDRVGSSHDPIRSGDLTGLTFEILAGANSFCHQL